MKVSRLFFFLFSLSLTLFSQFSLTIAGEIPGYVGQQSFRLQDDPQLGDLTRRATDAKVEVARVDQIKAQLSDQIRGLIQQRDNTLNHMNDLQARMEGARNLKASLQAKLIELNKNPTENQAQIIETQNKITEQDNVLTDLGRQYGASKLDLGPINVRLDQVQHDFGVASQNSQIAMGRLQAIARDLDTYRQELISSIQYINTQGARTGFSDGTNDGSSLARRLGQDIGSRDGNSDGLNQGTLDGQNRDYRQGLDRGDKDGSARGVSNGQRDGTNEGTISGNQKAADREGDAAGIKRGDASNAASVGISEGKTAGLDRAVRTGSVNGNNKGENETVEKFESGELNSIKMNGPFAGSFARRSPDYPGDFNGPSFNPNAYNNRELLKKAYTDGYLDQYRQYTRYEYLRRIDGEYNAVYNSNYSAAYNTTNNRSYPDYFEKGRSVGDSEGYNREYPKAKAQAYQIAFDQYNSNPNRSSIEYKSTYKSSELEAYNNRYEEIRSANYKRAELEVFNANIGAQTEIYRQKRIGEVTTVYNNNAVLSFVSSEISDAGISGIAKLDGVFQPGETTLHSITLKNFGLKPAQNVSVQLNNKEIVKIGEIPARSLVLVSGAGISQVESNISIGSNAKFSLKVLSKLTSDDAVEAQHFDSIGNGILKNADLKSVKIAYPLGLSNLSLNSQLLKGISNKLSISLANNSKRAYSGEMKIHLDVNSQSSIISKDFSTLTSLQTNAQLSDAEILVSNDADIYRDLLISATISINGVTLGVLPVDLVTMAKAQYSEKIKSPVIIANSDKNLKPLLDALSLAGGTEKVSVLDLSLATLNAQVLTKGLSGKVLLIVDDENGSNFKSLNGFLGLSQSSSFLFIDEARKGLENALTLNSSKDAQKVLWDKKTIMFTNPYRAVGVLKSSAMLQSSLKSFDQDLELAGNLTQTAPELLARLKSEINRNTFFTPSNSIKMFSLKTMAEILCINRAFHESGGIFTRDKKWLEKVGNDNSLFINVLKAASSGEVTEAKLSTVLPAIALKDTISNAMSDAEGISSEMMSRVQNATNKVLSNMEDSFKNSLKNFNKDLYNKAYEQASIHRPFYIKSSEDQSFN